jgi:hypothetical protein
VAEDRSLVRASDIGLWAFCHRAWWLANVAGAQHGNLAVLEHGTAVHAAHGAQVVRVRRLERLAILLGGAALLLLAAALLLQLFA